MEAENGKILAVSRVGRMALIAPLLIGGLAGFVLAYVMGIAKIGINIGSFQRSYLLWLLVLLCTGLALFLIIWPVWRFQATGQQQRIEQIRGFYSPHIIARYFKRFWAGRDAYAMTVKEFENADDLGKMERAKAELVNKFQSLLIEIFGRERIKSATRLLAFVAFLVLFVAFEGGIMGGVAAGPTPGSQHYLLGIKPDLASIAAIFGAYTWVASDVIYRYRQADLSSSDINWYTLRFIVAVPLGLALAQFSGFKGSDPNATVANSGPILAFVVSMFSLARVQEILGSLANRGLGVPTVAPDARDDATIKLPGIDQRLADRLAAEGVTTIAQIATTDPVRLSSRANIPFNLLIELIDAAILWQFIGPKLLDLREFGWTGASHVISFANRSTAGLQQHLDAYREAVITLDKARSHYASVEAELKLARERAQSAEALVTPETGQDAQERQVLQREKIAVEQLMAQQDSAKQSEENAARSCEQARADLAAMLPGSILEDMAKKAKMDVSAVRELIFQVSQNDYARFIYDLMRVGATSFARPETAVERAVISN